MANNLYARIIIAAQDSTAEALASVRTGFTGIGDAISNAKNLLLSYFAIDFIKTQVVDVIALADKYTDLTSRLKLSTTSHEELVRVQTALTEIAKTTRTDLESVETIYVRNIAAIKRMGGSEQDALAITETLTKAFKVSGATTEETTATLIQLSQGLSSGVLRGQEFNSMMEQGPRVAQALAAGLDVPIGSLRKMAEQGQLTSDRVLAALLSQKDAIATEYGQLEITVSGTMNVLATRFLEFVGKTNEATGATKTLVDGINYLTGASDRAGGSLVKTISDLLTKLSDLTSIQTLGTLLTTVFTDTKTAVGFVLEVVSQLWTTLSSSAEIARFGDALSNAFVVAEKLAKTLWDGITAILALFGSSTPQAWGDALAAMFSKVADVGSVALNTITTVLDTVKAGFFGLAGAGATAMQGLAEGIAKVQDGIAAISFGELSAKMTAQAENNRTVADAFGESAKLNFGKAETALTSAATSGLALRQAYSDLESGAAAVTAPVEQLTTAVS
jgi:tape measure domain-containing protein